MASKFKILGEYAQHQRWKQLRDYKVSRSTTFLES
jgi:hypothetical protein